MICNREIKWFILFRVDFWFIEIQSGLSIFDVMWITAQLFLNATGLICRLIHCSMKSHCTDCAFFTEEPGELYTHFMNAHTKIPVKSVKIPSYSLDCFASWSCRLQFYVVFFLAMQYEIDVLHWSKVAMITTVWVRRLSWQAWISSHDTMFWMMCG